MRLVDDSRAPSAAQRAKIRKLAAPGERGPEEEGGELNIVPFLDILVNVLMFVLATIGVVFTATIDTAPPRPAPGCTRDCHALGLSVIVVEDGFAVKAKGGNVAPGCDSLGPGLAVPKSGADYDFAALGRCAAKLKASSGAFADDSSVTVSASPAIAYATVIGVMDAVRKTDDGRDLFADVSFGLAE